MARALEMGALDVHFGLLLGELQHHRVGERGLAAAERAEASLYRGDRDAEGDLVAERLERHDAHVSR